jgi:7-cyano-7-deazaguanine synthase
MVKSAVCLLSGGIDSCVTIFIAKHKKYEIYGLSFKYGQRHEKEIECAKNIASKLNVKNHIIFDIDLYKFGGSSLIDGSLIPINNKLENIGKKIPNTYVPARNTVFLSIGLAYAETIDAESIFIGINSMDYSGYPDCRPEFIEAYQKMADLGIKRGINGKSINIKAPLLYFSKVNIIKKGLDLNVPFENTWSCYLGNKKACGKCDSCILRLKGFKELNIKDPIEYEFLPNWYIRG